MIISDLNHLEVTSEAGSVVGGTTYNKNIVKKYIKIEDVKIKQQQYLNTGYNKVYVKTKEGDVNVTLNTGHDGRVV
jgi:hypothetical protein